MTTLHIAILGLIHPEPNSTAAGWRMMQLIKFFQSQGHRVTFLTAASPTDFSEQSISGLRVIPIQVNDHSFDETICSLAPDVVIYDRFVTEEQFGWRISENLPQAITILDTEDLHFLRESRAAAFRKGKEHELMSLPATPLFSREMASILRCDLNLIISDFEMHLLTDILGVNPNILLYCPIYGKKKTDQPEFDNRKDFFTIGNFRHEPNWQSVLKLKALWPKIRKQCPEAELYIYGAYPPPKALELNNLAEGFLVKGRAHDLTEVFQHYRVLLAPLPFGAGIKGKLLEAMEYGVPSVTTSIGAEGMHWENLWSGKVTGTDEEFITAAVSLYQDKTQWQQAQINGYQILTKKFGKAEWEQQLSTKLNETLQNLEKHRLAHPLGYVLRHQTLQSTRYLSKYIEAKNTSH